MNKLVVFVQKVYIFLTIKKMCIHKLMFYQPYNSLSLKLE